MESSGSFVEYRIRGLFFYKKTLYLANMIIPIKFQYSVEHEFKRVINTIKTKAWLVDNGYRFSLPQGFQDSQSNESGLIRKLIQKEYNKDIYEVAEKAISKSWNGNCKLLKEINEKLVDSYNLDELNVILTKYGTQGSYTQPNSIIVNVSAIPPEFLIKTVVHESIHLMTEPLIKKNAVDHWVKERIVNLIIDLEFKSRFKMSPVPEWVVSVDGVFKQYYPNLELIMKEAPRMSN